MKEVLKLAIEAYCDRQDLIRRAEEAFEASQFNPDWSMLQAAHESLREHMSRIKELEAKLAQQEQIIQSYLEKDNSEENLYDLAVKADNGGQP